jgi:alpha-glucuronidase
VKYGIRKFQTESARMAFEANHSKGNWNISTRIDTSLGSEAYTIRTRGNEIVVAGGNGVGVMYGLLHVKEQLEQGKTKILDRIIRPGKRARY